MIRTKLPALILPLMLLGCSALPIQQSRSTVTSSDVSEPYQLDEYAQILDTYVDSKGLVDYEGLQANRQQLDRVVASFGAVTPETYATWSDPEKIAFLINAYNVFTLQSIIDQQPLKSSIRDIPGVWRVRKFDIAGDEQTLDTIEHGVLRKEFDEPRIHAALVCAAISCPPLRSEPFRGEQLDAQLDDQVNQWLEGEHGLKVDEQGDRVAISSIFEWFGEDWVPQYGNDQFPGNDKEKAVLSFISDYVSPETKAYLEQGGYDVTYLDYDWSLNDQG
ncbi:MAG: DUF547 domain-containing protein [Cyanobacteria bacterium P01_A01_bin.135]